MTGLSPLRYLDHAATASADAPAWRSGGAVRTYGEVQRRCRALAGALTAAGVRPGDRVALLSLNSVAALEAHYGVPAAGAVLVALNTRLNRDEIAFILQDAGARLALVDPELEHLLDACPVERLRLDGYEEVLASAPAGPDALADAAADERAPIALNYTSGTTGRPKGAIYTHRGAFLQAGNALRAIGLDRNSVFLWTLPMFHCNGWTYTWAVTAALGEHVILRSIDGERIWRLLEQHGVTHYCCAPTVQTAILEAGARRRLERPVSVAMGGAPPSPALIAQMRELGFEAMHLYGLTETYGPKAGIVPRPELLEGLGPDAQSRLLARQGYPLSPVDLLAVVDDDGAPVPRDGRTVGEVVIRGETVTPGYHERPEATAQAFRDGWFRTGDLAVWHGDHAIELRDRAKDVIISGGENISSIEVEQALAAHPAVLEAAVVAVPDERWGERPKGYVTLRPGGRASEQELIAHCRDRLAHFKCPVAIRFGPLPKTATGKILKRELREQEWAGRDRRIN
jgi:fatty-acyl-CoA synthase